MKVADLVGAMERLAPARLAASWDNVGLIVGDPGAELGSVLLTVDCTHAVLEEAMRGHFNAIVSYHPPIFEAQRRFLAGSIGYEAARAGICVFSPHTALDVALGGTNDVLADALEMTERAPIRAVAVEDSQYKLVAFVPPTHIEALSRAVFEAGAGGIGRYSSCSFRTPGIGTFVGDETTRPAVGQAGRLEHAEELRFETVVPMARVDDVVRALRAVHPYEEPAFDLVRVARASEGLGFGRVGRVPRASARETVERVKQALGVDHVLFAGPPERPITRAAVCAGSGGDLMGAAVHSGAELFLTGELRHHDALAACAADLALVCLRHSTSERAALVALERRLLEHLQGVIVARSVADDDPFTFA